MLRNGAMALEMTVLPGGGCGILGRCCWGGPGMPICCGGPEDNLSVLHELLGPRVHVGHAPSRYGDQLGLALHLLLARGHWLAVTRLHHGGPAMDTCMPPASPGGPA